jgi:serine/threonine protein kinase
VTTAAALGLDASGAKCVNQYAKVRKIGAGSYSKVVLHRSREDGALYAIKVLSRAALARRHVARGASALADAMREAQLLRLLSHPNIVRLEEVRSTAECVSALLLGQCSKLMSDAPLLFGLCAGD